MEIAVSGEEKIIALTEVFNDDDFLASIEKGGGLLFARSKTDEVDYICGWIKAVKITGNAAMIEIDRGVVKKPGRVTWHLRGSHTHSIKDLSSFAARPEGGGYHCYDRDKCRPAFKIFPRDSVPRKFTQKPEGLISLANILRAQK